MKKIIILGILAFWGISMQAQNNKAQTEDEKIREAYLNSDEYKNAITPRPITVEKANYVTESPKVIEENVNGMNMPEPQMNTESNKIKHNPEEEIARKSYEMQKAYRANRIKEEAASISTQQTHKKEIEITNTNPAGFIEK